MATTKTTTRSTTKSSAAKSSAAAKPSVDEKALLSTIKSLQGEVNNLRAEIATLRTATAPTPVTGDFVTRAQFVRALRILGVRGHQLEEAGLR